MRRFLFLTLVAWMSATANLLADSALSDAAGRTVLSLNGKWAYIIDPYDTGYLDYRGVPYDQAATPTGGFFLVRVPASESELVEYSFDDRSVLNVPGDWNTQSEKLFYYEGSIWYRRRFDNPTAGKENRYFIQFEGANYETEVYLNGRKLGAHVGGFTPFSFEVTEKLQTRQNDLIVRVNNTRRPEGVPTVNTDWWNYGGLTRDVRLVQVPNTFIHHNRVQLSRTGDKIQFQVQLDGEQRAQSIHLRIAELGIDQIVRSDASGFAKGEVPAPALERWSPEHPRLYAVEILAETDRTTQRIGFRTIETRGSEILLNGKPIFLKGVCLHEESPLRGGRANSREDAQLLLNWVRELHGNFVRLAHYPHNEYMAELADEMGILLWEEIPVYWTIQWTNPATLELARQQLRELIGRDGNRASVLIWSMANETPVSEVRTIFLKRLVDDARALDSTRLIAAAMEVRRDPARPNLRIVDDPFSTYTDILSFNEYVGWYDGTPELCDRVEWAVKSGKPVVISEFGGDALGGFFGSANRRFTEEFQADLYRRSLSMLEKIPELRGICPWILVDFRSPRRPLAGYQDGWNRKGLISDRGIKKQAFYILRDFYSKR